MADDISEPQIISPDYSVNVSYNISSSPVINAKNAIILDRASKTILYGKQENEICKMASTTKIMTFLVVLDNCSNLDEKVTVSKKAARNRRL